VRSARHRSWNARDFELLIAVTLDTPRAVIGNGVNDGQEMA
jgi:hypothetical protein